MLIFFSYIVGEEECNIYSSAYIKEIVNELQDENFLIILHNCSHNGQLSRSMVSTGAAALHFGNAADMKTPPENIYAFFDALDELNAVTHTL
jgi:uroporphyrinogen-III decarboxylase